MMFLCGTCFLVLFCVDVVLVVFLFAGLLASCFEHNYIFEVGPCQSQGMLWFLSCLAGAALSHVLLPACLLCFFELHFARLHFFFLACSFIVWPGRWLLTVGG